MPESSGERFTLPNGKIVSIMVLSQEYAERSWRISAGPVTRLLWTTQQAYVDGNFATLQNLGDASFAYNMIPEIRDLRPKPVAEDLVPIDSTGREIPPSVASSQWRSRRDKEPVEIKFTPTQTKPADSPAPLPADFKPSSRPRVVAAAPTEADWSRAATYSIPLPKSALADTPTEQHFLRITYTGDVARLSTEIDGKPHLLDDNFSDGRPWLIGLDRFAPQITQSGGKLDFSIYPLRANAPIFFESGNEPKPGTPPAALQSVELLTQYTLRLKLEPPTPQKK